jgi:hypothetical protein
MVSKSVINLMLILGAVVGVVIFWPHLTAGAQDSIMSDDQKNQIQTRCVSIKQTLNQLHANDAVIRVNRGQLYEAISVKMMVPMNSRITLNRLDGGELVGITASYDQTLSEFRDNYGVYERQLSDAIKIDCEKSPEKFYKAVQAASERRKAVHADVVRLHEQIQDYETNFKNFAAEFDNSTKEETSQ